MAMRSRLEQEAVAISVHAVCELLAGAELSQHAATERNRVLSFCEAAQIVYPDERFAQKYGQLQASLQRIGQTIGTMDLLIATAAVVDGASLITRNAREFRRIPSLDVIGY